MLNKRIIDEIGSKVSEIVEHSPAKDIERNVRAIMTSVFNRMELVTREEFDVQQKVLQRTREKLTELEEKVSALESQLTTDIAEQNRTGQSSNTC